MIQWFKFLCCIKNRCLIQSCFSWSLRVWMLFFISITMQQTNVWEKSVVYGASQVLAFILWLKSWHYRLPCYWTQKAPLWFSVFNSSSIGISVLRPRLLQAQATVAHFYMGCQKAYCNAILATEPRIAYSLSFYYCHRIQTCDMWHRYCASTIIWV